MLEGGGLPNVDDPAYSYQPDDAHLDHHPLPQVILLTQQLNHGQSTGTVRWSVVAVEDRYAGSKMKL